MEWQRRIIYGDRFMAANTAAVHMARWDDNIVWGFDTLDDNIVWGNDWDNIVWGNCTAARSNDADNIVWGNSADDNIVWGNNNCAAGNVANGKGGK